MREVPHQRIVRGGEQHGARGNHAKDPARAAGAGTWAWPPPGDHRPGDALGHQQSDPGIQLQPHQRVQQQSLRVPLSGRVEGSERIRLPAEGREASGTGLRGALLQHVLQPRQTCVRSVVDRDLVVHLFGIHPVHGSDILNRHAAIPIPGTAHHLPVWVLLHGRPSLRCGVRSQGQGLLQRPLRPPYEGVDEDDGTDNNARNQKGRLHDSFHDALFLQHGQLHLVGDSNTDVVPGRGDEVGPRGH